MHAFHIQNLNVKSPFNIRKEEIKPKDGTSRKCHSMIAKFTRYSLLVKQIIPLMSESLSRLKRGKTLMISPNMKSSVTAPKLTVSSKGFQPPTLAATPSTRPAPAPATSAPPTKGLSLLCGKLKTVAYVKLAHVMFEGSSLTSGSSEYLMPRPSSGGPG